jgi:hypothetical protein
MIEAAGAFSGHQQHVGLLLGPMLLLAFWAGWADLRAWIHRQGDDLAPAGVLVAAAASLGAGLIHALVTPAHFSEDPIYGVFFAATAAVQLAWAVHVVRRPDRRLLQAGGTANVLLIALWAQTRLLTIPLGVAAGTRESAGVLDVTCVLLELLVVCMVMTPWSAAARSGPG